MRALVGMDCHAFAYKVGHELVLRRLVSFDVEQTTVVHETKWLFQVLFGQST